MPRYIVDECEDDAAALQETLDYMSERGCKVVSMMWLPKRKKWGPDGEFDANAQYVVVFEREETDAHRT